MTIAIAQTAHFDAGTAIWGDSTHTGTYPTPPTTGNGKVVICMPNRDRSLNTASDADGSFTVLHTGSAPGGSPNYGGGIAAKIAASTTDTVTATTNANTTAGNAERLCMLEFSDIADPVAEVGTSGDHQEPVATNTHGTGQSFDPGAVDHYILFRHIGFTANPGTVTPNAPPTGSWVSLTTGDTTRWAGYLIVEGNSDPVDMGFATGGTARISYQQWAGIAGNAGEDPPSITNLNGDDTVENGAAAQTLNGTGIDDSAATLEFEQGAVVVSQTVTARTTTTITFTDVESNGVTHLKFGTTTARVTNGDDQEDTHSFTREPETGTDHVVIATVSGGTILQFDPALDTGDQVQWRVTDGDFDETDFNVNDDGTFDITEGLDPEDVEARRWDATNSTWSAWAAIEFPAAASGGHGHSASPGRCGGMMVRM